MILFEKKYQTFDTVFHHQMKHLEVRQKYSATRRFFNSLLGVSSGDETLRLMLDILLQYQSLYIMWGEIKMKCRYEKKKSICSKTISMLGIWMTFYGVATLKGQISAHTKK